MGYSTYIAFFIGFFGNIVVIYKLAVEPVIASDGILQSLFPRLTTFVAATLIITVPASIYIGLYHMKRTGAYATETSVAVESNPYVYTVTPGKEQEVILPLMILTARGLAKIMEQQHTFTIDERKEFETVLSKASKLLAGQVVGLPRHKGLLREAQRTETS
jgi:hypothetical protein